MLGLMLDTIFPKRSYLGSKKSLESFHFCIFQCLADEQEQEEDKLQLKMKCKIFIAKKANCYPCRYMYQEGNRIFDDVIQ